MSSAALMMESAIRHPRNNREIAINSSYLEIAKHDLCKAIMFAAIEDEANVAIAYDRDKKREFSPELGELTYLGQVYWQSHLMGTFDEGSVIPRLGWFIRRGILKAKMIGNQAHYWANLDRIQAMLDEL